MKKYSVSVAYAGSIIVEVEAENEDDAYKLARDIADNMNDQDFLEQLDPQYQETDIIEEIL